MNREMVLGEWRHARDALRAANVLAREDLRADAVSRAYYAILHAAKAALQVHDVAADSHAAVSRLFGLHLIRSGAIEPEWSAHLAKSLDERFAADYDAEATFTAADVKDECRRAQKFLGRIRRYLLANGLADRDLRSKAHHG